MLKDTSGAPTGVRVYWWRVNENDVIGYYVYRDTEPITEADQSLRVNEGEIIYQPDETEPAILYDDLFAAEVGATYYYRITAVDYGWDESRLSIQRSITISPFVIEDFSPLRGPVGRAVTINGQYFGEYNDQTDAVYFTGVKNDKGPSALYTDVIKASIVSWENERVRASVPLGTTVGPITIVCNNTPQETNGDFECTSPYILSVFPDPATAGEEINFYGANFGPPDATNKLLVDDVAYGGVFTSWSDDHVVAILPGSLEAKLSKLELLIDIDITNPYYCAIISGNQPVIDKITPGFGDAGESGTTVEIQGSYFGGDIGKVTVWFNGVALTGRDIDYFSDTLIRLTVPEGASCTGEVHVIVDDYGPLESNHYLYHTLPGWPSEFNMGVIAGANVGMHSDVAYHTNGDPFIVFSEKNQDSSGVFLRLAYPADDKWAAETLDSKYMNGEYLYPRVHVDTSGVVHFAFMWDSPMGGEVRYGTWDGGTVADELVYANGTGTHPGEYLDMLVLDDGLGGIDRLLVWSNELDSVMCGYKLDGETSWTTDVVYTADGAYSEEAGYYCSIDCAEQGGGAPPPWRTPSSLGTSYYVGISFGLYSEDGGAHYDVLFAYSSDLDTWGAEIVGTSTEPVTETVMRWHELAAEPFILWSTNEGVSWSYYDSGWSDMWVAGNGSQYGAALGLYIDESTDVQYAYGTEGENACFYASYDPLSNEWDTSSEWIPGGRELYHVGRGGAAMNLAGEEIVMSVYDPDMRDVALLTFDSGANLYWEDVADGFATPGYDLANRALVFNSNAVPHVVFGDIDPVTGERTLWMARPTDMGQGPFSPSAYGGWEFSLIDSAASGTLGHATMAVDSSDDYHVAYLKGEDVMYVRGSFGNLGTPQSIFTPGQITTAPQIALGVNSQLDVNIVVPQKGAEWQLMLLQSDDGMATHSEISVFIAPSFSPITQYDVAVRHDGYAVVVGYHGAPADVLRVWDQSDNSWIGYDQAAGMDAGVSVTLDEDMHYCVTVADLGNGTGHLLHWDSGIEDYVFEQFAADAEGAEMISQWRNEYGPFISYTNEDFIGQDAVTEGWLYWDEGRGFRDYHVWSFYGDSMPLRHSVDPFYYYAGLFAYHPDVTGCRYLFVMMGPAP